MVLKHSVKFLPTVEVVIGDLTGDGEENERNRGEVVKLEPMLRKNV